VHDTLITAPTYIYVPEPSYGLLEIHGPDAEDLLHRLSTNDIMQLDVGGSITTVFANPKGRIIDRVRIAKTHHAIYLYTSPDAAPIIKKWLDSYTFMEDVTVIDITEKKQTLEVMGARADDILNKLNAIHEISPNEYNQFHGMTPNETRSFPLCDSIQENTLVITRTDDPIYPCYLVQVQSSYVDKFLAAELPNTQWLSPSERDALRIYAGIPKAPNEINLKTNPLEIGLRTDISFNKGCYIGQEVILRLDTYKKVKRHLVKVSLGAGTTPLVGSDIVIKGSTLSSGRLTSIAEKIDGGFEGLALIKSGVRDYDQDFEIHQPGVKLQTYLYPIETSK